MKVSSTLMAAALAAIGALTAFNSAVLAGNMPGPSFHGYPPDAHHPWAVHDPHRPQPPIVTPGTCSTQAQPGKPPSDAIVLFDGKDLSQWESDKPGHVPAKWIVKDGYMQCVPGTGYIRTKAKIGDCQLHIEWAAPTPPRGSGQGRGNSGVFLMGLVEVQVLDNYHNPTYADGTAGAIYGQHPPLVNALRPPGQFQCYDIIFRRPIYKNGKCLDPGSVTVFLNGVLVQDHALIEGPTLYCVRATPRPFPKAAPLKLQDHGNPVRFRNIWYRPLPPRAIDGGDLGPLTVEQTMAKREKIAAAIRAQAKKEANPSNPLPELLRLMEALQYTEDASDIAKVKGLAEKYVALLNALPPRRLSRKKNEVKHLDGVFKFLARFHRLPNDFGPRVEIERIIAQQQWNKRR